MWNSKTLKLQNMYIWKFKNSNIQECFTTYSNGYNVHDALRKKENYIKLKIKNSHFLVWFQIIIIFQDET
jgi:hypothetical protein